MDGFLLTLRLEQGDLENLKRYVSTGDFFLKKQREP